MSTEARPLATELKAALTSKAMRARPHGSRSATKTGTLVCGYCGSDDLAPSFRKRRDARCRACCKKRYGSAARGGKSSRTPKKPAK